MHTHAHTHTHAQTRTHTHTQTHTNTQKHTHSRVQITSMVGDFPVTHPKMQGIRTQYAWCVYAAAVGALGHEMVALNATVVVSMLMPLNGHA